MIKIGPKPKRPIVICELVKVSKKIVAVRPAEHPIVGVAIKGNETWTVLQALRVMIVTSFSSQRSVYMVSLSCTVPGNPKIVELPR